MYTVYIIKSQLIKRYYIGHTDDLIKRLSYHNSGRVKSTKAFRPWNVIYTEDCSDKHSAYKRELQVKSYKGGEAFKKLITKNKK